MWFTRKARRDDNGEGGTARALLAERDDILAELAAAKAQLARIRGLVASNEDDDILAAVQFLVTERHHYHRLVEACSRLAEAKEEAVAEARARLDAVQARLDLLSSIEAAAIAATKRANRAEHERDALLASVATGSQSAPPPSRPPAAPLRAS